MDLKEEKPRDTMLRKVAEEQIRVSFVPDHRPMATREEGLGIALAHHFKWNGLSLLKTMRSALEDANFHTLNETVDHWIKEIEHGK